jgi:hypothetical protein
VSWCITHIENVSCREGKIPEVGSACARKGDSVYSTLNAAFTLFVTARRSARCKRSALRLGSEFLAVNGMWDSGAPNCRTDQTGRRPHQHRVRRSTLCRIVVFPMFTTFTMFTADLAEVRVETSRPRPIRIVIFHHGLAQPPWWNLGPQRAESLPNHWG